MWILKGCRSSFGRDVDVDGVVDAEEDRDVDVAAM